MPAPKSSAAYNQVQLDDTDDQIELGSLNHLGSIYPSNTNPSNAYLPSSHQAENVPSNLFGPEDSAGLANLLRERGKEHGESKKSSPAKAQERATLALTHWWWIELAAATLSFTCVITLLILLRRFDGHFLDTWMQNIHIRPNTLASTLMTVAKTTLLLPVAKSISQLKWIHFKKQARALNKLDLFDDASRGPLGALQLLWDLLYHEKAKISSWMAILGCIITIVALAIEPFTQRSISIMLRSHCELNESASLGTTQMYKSDVASPQLSIVPMQLNFFDGIYSREIPEIFSCSSGNCTWPDFTSLGICSSCQNVTDNTEKRCDLYDPLTEKCHYQTPGGHDLTVSISDNDGSSGTILNITASYDDWNPIHVAAYMLSGSQKDNSWAGIYECSLSWCGKVYSNASVQQGILQGVAPTGEYPLSKTSSEEFTGVEDVHLTAPDDFPGNKTFTIDGNTLLSLQQFLLPIFTTSVTTENDTFTSAFTFSIGYPLYETSNISKSMFNVATSLTNYIRNGPYAENSHGEECPTRQYVSVNWGWLVLPVSIVILAIILVAASIAYNHQSGTLLWKSSSLPFLFHGLDGWHNKDLNLNILEQMEHSAKDMRGQLRRNADDEIKIMRTVRAREPYQVDPE